MATSGTAASGLVCAMLLAGCGLTLDLDPQPEGSRPSMDAGTDAGLDAARDGGREDADADACSPVPEACDGTDDDCDGRVDEAFALSSDPRHCGECDNACPAIGGVARCSEGVCVPDCDGLLVACDGACVDLDADRSHCGACGNECFVDEHGRIECVAGACTVLDCGDWRGDCNMDASDGCERLLLTNTDCGACDVECEAGETCASGVCSP